MRTFADYPLAELVALHRLDAVLRVLGSGRDVIPPSSKTTSSAKPRALSSRTRARMLDQLVAEKWVKASGVVGFWPANRDGDDIVLCAEKRALRTRAPAHAAPADGQGRGQGRISRWRISSRRRELATMSAPSRSPPASARKRSPSASSAPTTIIPPSWRKALCDRLAEAFAEALHAKVRRELWGYAPDEDAHDRRTDRREVSRHPPRARLSRAARSHREAHHLRSARCTRERRHGSDRKHGDDAAVLGLRPLFRASASGVFRRRHASIAIRSTIMRAARAGVFQRRSAGFRRSSPTSLRGRTPPNRSSCPAQRPDGGARATD